MNTTTTKIPDVVPALPREGTWKRPVAPSDAFAWLRAGWRDCMNQPVTSLGYGLIVFAISATILYSLFVLRWDYAVLPVLAGFAVVGPLLAIGLYEKSRRIAAGERLGLRPMILVRPKSGGQLAFTGLVLCLLMLLWLRAAVILYALFFGMRPFPGLDDIAAVLFTTGTGWTMLAVGTAIGGLFAAFSFAISAFSIPMLLDQRTDALTAMGTSVALVWSNLPTMLTWGAIVLALFLLGVASGMIGLVLVFPILGHATWHAYRAIRP